MEFIIGSLLFFLFAAFIAIIYVSVGFVKRGKKIEELEHRDHINTVKMKVIQKLDQKISFKDICNSFCLVEDEDSYDVWDDFYVKQALNKCFRIYLGDCMMLAHFLKESALSSKKEIIYRTIENFFIEKASGNDLAKMYADALLRQAQNNIDADLCNFEKAKEMIAKCLSCKVGKNAFEDMVGKYLLEYGSLYTDPEEKKRVEKMIQERIIAS
jgi:hypothetical protein